MTTRSRHLAAVPALAGPVIVCGGWGEFGFNLELLVSMLEAQCGREVYVVSTVASRWWRCRVVLPEVPPAIASLSHGVDRLLNALPGQRVTLVGHSLGALVGLAAALRRPERVERVIWVCPAVVRDGLGRLAGRLNKETYHVMGVALRDRSARLRLLGGFLYCVLNPLRAFREGCAIGRVHSNLEEMIMRLRDSEILLDVIAGQDDLLIPLSHLGRVKALADSFTEVPGGHMPRLGPLVDRLSEILTSS